MYYSQIKSAYILISILLILSLLSTDKHVESQGVSEQDDILVYVADNSDFGASLMMFTPFTGVHTELYQGRGRLGFEVSTTGKVAIVDWTVGTDTSDDAFFLLNQIDSDGILIDLGELLGMHGNPLGWSPEGSYLAYSSYDSEGMLRLFLWDGEGAIDITPDSMIGDPSGYEIAWSNDERLAFTIFFGWFGDSPKAEIYLWDGNSTHNMSQNPDGEDRSPAWSSTNQLAFLSQRDDIYGVYVWDGQTLTGNMPAVSSFTEIAPDVTRYFSYPVWTNANQLAFSGISPDDERSQIYLWDEETATNISHNPDYHNGAPRWATNGNWAFVTYFSSGQYIYIRNQENITVLRNDGQYVPAWSSNNYMIFCDLGDVGLSMWTGDEVISLVSGWEIWAQWQSGQKIVCSSG